jgi:predicted ArsR family transcriptional regulator
MQQLPALALTDRNSVSDDFPGMEPTAGERYVALAVPSRRRLVDALRDADGPLDVTQLAAAVQLHTTTARFHLDVLERAGLVRRTQEAPNGPGRPRLLYTLSTLRGGNGAYQELATALAGVLAEDAVGAPRLAEEAGRRWAEVQVSDRQHVGWQEGTQRIGELFERLGFAPRVVDVDGGRQVQLHACPFRDVARAHPDVVCRVHLGLLRGALSRLGLTSEAGSAGLRPFVTPELCIADLPFPGAGTGAARG